MASLEASLQLNRTRFVSVQLDVYAFVEPRDGLLYPFFAK